MFFKKKKSFLMPMYIHKVQTTHIINTRKEDKKSFRCKGDIKNIETNTKIKN